MSSRVWAARDSIATMLAQVRGVTVTRSSGRLEDPFGRLHVACRLTVNGRFANDGTGAADLLGPWLEAHGWVSDGECSADGPDGTVWGMRRQGVRCLVSGQWDGGDDSDSTYVPSRDYVVIIDCLVDVPNICPH
jgi:hypothetical protein